MQDIVWMLEIFFVCFDECLCVLEICNINDNVELECCFECFQDDVVCIVMDLCDQVGLIIGCVEDVDCCQVDSMVCLGDEISCFV